MVGSVARCVGDLEALDRLPSLQPPDPLLRDRSHLAPQPVHVVAVQPRGALQELGRVDQMRCAVLVHVDHELGIAPAEHAGRTGVVEVYVREEQGVRDVVPERIHEGVHASGGPGIDDHTPDLVGADHAIAAQVHDVDWPAHDYRPYISPLGALTNAPEAPHPWRRLPCREDPFYACSQTDSLGRATWQQCRPPNYSWRATRRLPAGHCEPWSSRTSSPRP